MRMSLFLLIAGFSIASCSNNKENSSETNQPLADSNHTTVPVPQSTAALQALLKPFDHLLGSFVGPFGRNKITLLIIKVTKDSVVGRTIVGGNDRPFYGTYFKEGGSYFFNAKEPGDHRDDGEFNFVLDETRPDILKGSWKPFAKGREGKEYELQRKEFKYSPDVGYYPQASQRLLKPEDVENEMKEDLEFMRNEIFARHGYCFNRYDMRQQFEMEDWYVPNTVDIKGFLTDVEKKNIALIKRYEKYADDYGDEYGR